MNSRVNSRVVVNLCKDIRFSSGKERDCEWSSKIKKAVVKLCKCTIKGGSCRAKKSCNVLMMMMIKAAKQQSGAGLEQSI